MLENLLPTRQRENVAKSLGKEAIEEQLTTILRVSGESALHQIRDQARTIAPTLAMEKQFQTLDRLIAALLCSKPASLATSVARAYASGEPYDRTRLPLLDAAFATLRSESWPDRSDRFAHLPAFYNVAFFDAYFSNYIEGTMFPIDQAIRIVFENEIPANRPDDAHDVIGTYRLVASQDEMSRRPENFEDFLDLLKRRHATIMQARPTLLPGQFKITNNPAGNTVFVAPEMVVGTLRQGFERYQALEEPFARALFMMLLITEVHPFADGNGRIARVMMNAEQIAAGQTRIFIPSVYRNEYMGSLKRLTHHHQANALVKVMSQAQLFVHRIDFTELNSARQMLAKHNAFDDPSDDVKLKMPESQF